MESVKLFVLTNLYTAVGIAGLTVLVLFIDFLRGVI